MEEYTEEQYKKDYIRMMDSLRETHTGDLKCNGVVCYSGCPLYRDGFYKELCNIWNAVEAVEVVRKWAKEHPEPHIETNGEHYKKEFGHENITTCCYADEETLKNCDSECETCRYNADAPYHAPESVKE